MPLGESPAIQDIYWAGISQVSLQTPSPEPAARMACQPQAGRVRPRRPVAQNWPEVGAPHVAQVKKAPGSASRLLRQHELQLVCHPNTAQTDGYCHPLTRAASPAQLLTRDMGGGGYLCKLLLGH